MSSNTTAPVGTILLTNRRGKVVKTQIIVASAMLVGAALGAVGVNGLQAQSKPGAYAVIEISEITNADEYKKIAAIGGAAATSAGGHFVVRTDKATATDGETPKRVVIIGFDSMDKLKAWNASAAQREVDALRLKTTKSRQFFVDGFSN
jgi:uncharacterized protein (DUF1330 family)